MPSFISPSQAAQLRRIARRYKRRAKLGRPWHQRTDNELWIKVLGEVAAVGRAEPGRRLETNAKVKRKLSIRRLRQFRTDAGLQEYLHGVFEELRVRYVGSSWQGDRKAAAAVKNFRKLTDRNRPKAFFEQIAKRKTEGERIEVLQNALQYYGNKVARDILIDLRLAENCIALDARIYGLLAKVGVKVSPDDIYKQIEKELIQKVATPLGMSGALLDRVLFQNYKRILEQK